jgi:hypothetical protein
MGKHKFALDNFFPVWYEKCSSWAEREARKLSQNVKKGNHLN